MDTELTRLIELTEKLTRDGYLKSQTDEWECVLDAIPECIYITNINKYIRFINRALQVRLGIGAKNEVYTTTCFSLLGHKGCLCEADKTDYDLIKWCGVSEIVFLAKLNGWFESSMTPIYSRIGKLLGYICVLKEVTEGKMTEQFAIERQKLIDAVYVSSPSGIGLMEQNEMVLKFSNSALLKLTGYSEKELIGNSVRKLFVSDVLANKVFNLISNKEYIEGSISIETAWVKEDGTNIDVLMSIIKTIGASNIIFNVIDITEVYRN